MSNIGYAPRDLLLMILDEFKDKDRVKGLGEVLTKGMNHEPEGSLLREAFNYHETGENYIPLVSQLLVDFRAEGIVCPYSVGNSPVLYERINISYNSSLSVFENDFIKSYLSEFASHLDL